MALTFDERDGELRERLEVSGDGERARQDGLEAEALDEPAGEIVRGGIVTGVEHRGGRAPPNPPGSSTTSA